MFLSYFFVSSVINLIYSKQLDLLRCALQLVFQGPVSQKHDGFIIYELHSKLVSFLAQASVYPSRKTLAYHKIVHFSV